MLEASGADIDPAIFQRDNDNDFGILIGLTVGQLEQAGEIIGLHDEFDPDVASRGVAKMIEDEGGEVAEAYERLVESTGEDFMAGIIGKIGNVSGHTAPPVSEEEYQEAVKAREEAATTLVDHTIGHHDFMRESLAKAYGEDGESVDEEAWTATWKRLKDMLGGVDGTFLAEVAGFFDGLIREEFGPAFKPMDEDRGPAVQADVCARTFYRIMQDHVPRAIVGANRDEWTGYE
jgi:hypothetical protein